MILLQKIKDFDIFTKLTKNLEDLCKLTVAQSPINHPIWSHICNGPLCKAWHVFLWNFVIRTHVSTAKSGWKEDRQTISWGESKGQMKEVESQLQQQQQQTPILTLKRWGQFQDKIRVDWRESLLLITFTEN